MKKYPKELYDEGACMGIDVNEFFPPHGKTHMKEVEGICRSCPVLDVCFEWALHNERHGYWGGTTAVQRTELRRALNIILVTPEERSKCVPGDAA